MNHGVIQIRADICADCTTPCVHQHDPSYHACACAACPMLRWSRWGACDQLGTAADIHGAGGVTAPAAAASLRGMGDVLAIIADPIASTVGIDKARCGCGQRQKLINEELPFARPMGDDGIVI